MGNSRIVAFYITVCVIAFVISKIIIAVLVYRRWQRKHKTIHDSLSGGKLVMFRSSKMKTLKSNMFLKKTMKLSNKDRIGAGGYGTVYRLTINESTSFAVKRLNRGSAEQDRGFERELEAMSDIKHRNIVTLHGYYTAPHYNLLIYELMPNGSLHQVLHGRSEGKKVLDWPSRYKIAVGAARGISYLHQDCIPHIIHRDIKSSNILLDQNMEARVSDFGLATLMEPNNTHVSTLVAGTFGYLAPEYFDTGRATAKGDVYSFGVVLLELLTGKKPTDEAFLEEGTKLVTWVKSVVKEKKEEYVLDSSLECCPLVEINRVFSIALMCLESEPSKRPTMAEIINAVQMEFPCQPIIPVQAVQVTKKSSQSSMDTSLAKSKKFQQLKDLAKQLLLQAEAEDEDYCSPTSSNESTNSHQVNTSDPYSSSLFQDAQDPYSL